MATQPQTIPTITGYPGIDSLVRTALVAASAAAAGIIVGWLNAHGFNDPNLSLMLSGVIFGVLTTLAVAFWGWFKGTQVGKAIDDAHLVGVQSGVAAQQSSAVIATPVDLTHTDAQEIIKTFAPTASTNTTGV